MFSYIFGPINSRRFGTSLGIDLSPLTKRCNFDCLYCELKPKKAISTSNANIKIDDVINELKEALIRHPNVDVITLTANGEPTMYREFDLIINKIKQLNIKAKLLLLSNASLIANKDIQKSLCKIDCVKLSLDAVTPNIFKKIDRPHKSITIDDIKLGILEFSKIYKKELVIEILFVKGINDTANEIKLLNDYLLKLQPNRIDLGTIDRPPAYGVLPISNDDLNKISKSFSSKLNVKVTHRKPNVITQSSYTKDEIISTLDKRALTTNDVQVLFDLNSRQNLDALIKEGEVTLVDEKLEKFYILKKKYLKK